ncbi:P-loop containing nucleoside triphosphate hydrolase protein [Lactarius psammicola]|nr:P-loop containing nucleoside triphosphate hydrolase protein [Lactarius psammicola]
MASALSPTLAQYQTPSRFDAARKRLSLLLTCFFPHPPSLYILTLRLVTLRTNWGHLRRRFPGRDALCSFVTVSRPRSMETLPVTLDMEMMDTQASTGELPSLEAMRAVVKDRFGFFPCKWQLEAALTQLEKRDLVTLAPTGSGKTLTFWIPLLFNGDGITIVITPLNILGNKNVVELSAVSIPAINLTMATASEITFKDIESLKYRVIITSPKHVLTDRKFLELWKSTKFVKKLRSFMFDEAHCISQWSGEFRPEYADVGRLRWLLPDHVVFHAVSATLPSHILGHIREIRLSNDRPNIHLLTLEMLDPVHLCYDILQVLRFDGDPPPPLFMVFCNDRRETERLCQFARSQAPSELVDNLLWFHSGMSTKFRTETIKKLHSHEIWGIFCTDAAEMASGS